MQKNFASQFPNYSVQMHPTKHPTAVPNGHSTWLLQKAISCYSANTELVISTASQQHICAASAISLHMTRTGWIKRKKKMGQLKNSHNHAYGCQIPDKRTSQPLGITNTVLANVAVTLNNFLILGSQIPMCKWETQFLGYVRNPELFYPLMHDVLQFPVHTGRCNVVEICYRQEELLLLVLGSLSLAVLRSAINGYNLWKPELFWTSTNAINNVKRGLST